MAQEMKLYIMSGGLTYFYIAMRYVVKDYQSELLRKGKAPWVSITRLCYFCFRWDYFHYLHLPLPGMLTQGPARARVMFMIQL